MGQEVCRITAATEKRESGIALIGSLPWGTRLCQFYRTGQDLLDILVPYFRTGLENNEFCLWIVSDPLDAETALKAMKESVPDFEKYSRKNQLEIVPGSLWHAHGGATGSALVAKLDQAISAGFEGVRLAVIASPEVTGGDAFGGDGTDVFGRYNVIGIFAYPRDQFSTASLMEVVKNHRFALVHNGGKWEVMESSEALHRTHNELELRVQERTSELQKAYETLKTEAEERRRLEDRLRQSQKMEALGTLAGGIAHDFNNILGGIIGFTEMMLEDISPEDPTHRQLKLVLKAGQRGRDLVKQILSFSRHTEQKAKEVAVSGAIDEALNLLRPALPSTIDIRTKVASAHDTVVADPVQLHQVLMNLCTNAAHAMRNGGGLLEIGLTDICISEKKALGYPDMKPGPYLQLSVSDTGCGMPAHVMEKIFDPFFTTKNPGEGTGLGLSVVHGIVKSHGGSITVSSEPDKGTVFHVYLPKAEPSAFAEASVPGSLQGGREWILFVDDEEMLVEMNHQRLVKLGYQVVSSTSSPEALALFKKEPHKFDLVITDYTMPRMTGLDLAKALVEIRPDIPVILCSGVNEQIAAQHGVKAFIAKTAGKEELAELIRKVLTE